MTLMLRLGLRANEIACLELGDLHWRTGEIAYRRRSVICGEVLESVRIENDRATLLREVAKAGPDAQVRPGLLRTVGPPWQCSSAWSSPCHTDSSATTRWLLADSSS